MKIQPRQQILETWQAAVRASYQDGQWVRSDRYRPNSISDAEQLLCIMYPATDPKLTSFRLENPNETAEDILSALEVLGDSIDIPQVLIRVMTEYMERYTDDEGTPIFSGEGYFDPSESGVAPTPTQEQLNVIDSFSMSITLTLAALGFTRVFRGVITREERRQAVERLEKLASTRLSAAMVGLLRSFSVNVFDVNSSQGRILRRRTNRPGLSERQVTTELQDSLREIRSGLRDLTIGSGQTEDIDSPNRFFECGWSWGIVKDTEPMKTDEEIGPQPLGVAEDKPYLYFTVVALDGIEDLFSPRTRLLGLLNDEQRRLADALQNRWELTQQYWFAIASADTGSWPLEDLPWRTSDGSESDYFSLLVTSVVVQNLVRRRAPDTELARVVSVLQELAGRGRVNRRPLDGDTAIELHAPGVRIRLRGSEEVGEHTIGWRVSNFAPLLLKRTIAIAALVRDAKLRGDLIELAESVWDHLLLRRIDTGPGQALWDQPKGAFDDLDIYHELPSWHYTERVIECLVGAANLVSQPPLRSEPLAALVDDMLDEADHLFDRERLSGSSEGGPAMRGALKTVGESLRRARDIMHDRPGSAMMLVGEVLRELERLAAARQDLAGGA